MPIGRPVYKPNARDLKLVQNLCLLGLSEERTAKCVGIALETLRKYYGEVLENYRDKTLSKVAECAMQLALKGNPSMIMFVLKTRAGWSEKVGLDDDTKQLIKRVIGVKEEEV